MKKAAIKRLPKSKRKCAKVARQRVRKLFAKKKRKVSEKLEKIGGVPCSESDGSDSDSRGPVKALVNYKKGWKRTCPRDYPRKTLEPAKTKRNYFDVPWQNES